MKFENLKERELININTGEKLGLFGSCDLNIDIETGKIISLLIPEGKAFFQLFNNDEKYVEVPWEKIVKIGKDTIMISL